MTRSFTIVLGRYQRKPVRGPYQPKTPQPQQRFPHVGSSEWVRFCRRLQKPRPGPFRRSM